MPSSYVSLTIIKSVLFNNSISIGSPNTWSLSNITQLQVAIALNNGFFESYSGSIDIFWFCRNLDLLLLSI